MKERGEIYCSEVEHLEFYKANFGDLLLVSALE